MKKLFTNIVLTLLAFVFAFGCGEIVVRSLFKEDTVLFSRYQTGYQYGRYAIRGIRPNARFWHTSVDGTWEFVTNSKGFRNTREFDYLKAAGTLRVISLGDSNTQGYEVRQNQTYSAVLERALSRNGRQVEVINTGVSGFGTAEQLVLLENEVIRYQPDVVVVGFFANDFDDNLKSGLFALDRENRLVEKKTEHLPGVRIQDFIYAVPGVGWLGDNSYFYSMLFNNAWIFAKLQLGRLTARQAAADGAAGPTEIGGFEYTIPQRVTPYQTNLAFALLARIKATCDRAGIRLWVVDIPAYPAPYRSVTSLPPGFAAQLNAAGIGVVTSESLLGPYDGAAEMHVLHGYHHISEFTHTLIGNALAARIAP